MSLHVHHDSFNYFKMLVVWQEKLLSCDLQVIHNLWFNEFQQSPPTHKCEEKQLTGKKDFLVGLNKKELDSTNNDWKNLLY